jgi:flagellar basal-body rod protein FlgC
MADAMTIAASGMQAASQALFSVASNLANAATNGPVPTTPPSQPVPQMPGNVYQPTMAVQSTTPDGGVATSLQPSLPGYNLAYDAQAPYANMQGMIASPNVDLATQVVAQISAANSFRASGNVFAPWWESNGLTDNGAPSNARRVAAR